MILTYSNRNGNEFISATIHVPQVTLHSFHTDATYFFTSIMTFFGSFIWPISVLTIVKNRHLYLMLKSGLIFLPLAKLMPKVDGFNFLCRMRLDRKCEWTHVLFIWVLRASHHLIWKTTYKSHFHGSYWHKHFYKLLSLLNAHYRSDETTSL